MSGRRNFSELKQPILDDPVRAERFTAAREEAESEHRAFALDELRRRLGVSQDRLADALGIGQPAVSLALREAKTLGAIRRLVAGMDPDASVELTVVRHGERVPLDV